MDQSYVKMLGHQVAAMYSFLWDSDGMSTDEIVIKFRNEMIPKEGHKEFNDMFASILKLNNIEYDWIYDD